MSTSGIRSEDFSYQRETVKADTFSLKKCAKIPKYYNKTPSYVYCRVLVLHTSVFYSFVIRHVKTKTKNNLMKICQFHLFLHVF